MPSVRQKKALSNTNPLICRYAGEVNVAQAELPAFLKTAERLKVKGLAEVNQNDRQDR